MKLRTLLPLSALLLLLTPGCAHLQADLDACRGQLGDCNDELAATKAEVARLKSALADAKTAGDLANKRMTAYRDLAQRLRDAFGSDDLEIFLRNGRLIVQLPNRILFDLGQATVKPEGVEALQKLASVLSQVPERQFLIAGHTDNVPVSERSTRYKSNWELSTLRGVAVVQVLSVNAVAPTQLGAAGYGEFMPEASNDTEEGRAANRRTEIIVMPLLSEIPELPTW